MYLGASINALARDCSEVLISQLRHLQEVELDSFGWGFHTLCLQSDMNGRMKILKNEVKSKIKDQRRKIYQKLVPGKYFF